MSIVKSFAKREDMEGAVINEDGIITGCVAGIPTWAILARLCKLLPPLRPVL